MPDGTHSQWKRTEYLYFNPGFLNNAGMEGFMIQRSRIGSLTVLIVLCLSAAGLLGAGTVWKKYVAADKTFSFHYPSGWTVEAKESTIDLRDPKTGEQLLLVALPYDKAKSPADSGNWLIDALRQSTPDIKATDWTPGGSAGNATAACQVAYTEKGHAFQSEVLVIKNDGAAQVLWISFTAPQAGYSRDKALSILNGFASSVAKGPDSEPPQEGRPASASIDRDGRAFIFVLEFAMGVPFTGGQEEIIRAELSRGWEKLSVEELRKYDAYPQLVEAIIHAANVQAVDKLRSDLEKTTREWLQASDQTDPAVAVIADQMKKKGKVLVPGTPALTVMAAEAYSEMYAYSELLAAKPGAAPDQVPASSVAEVRGRLVKAWAKFTTEEREQVARTPGLWVSLRSVLRFGSAQDQKRVRTSIAAIASPDVSGGEASGSGGSRSQGSSVSEIGKNIIKHNVLMNINQMTFNHYMYCHGFKSTMY